MRGKPLEPKGEHEAGLLADPLHDPRRHLACTSGSTSAILMARSY